MLESSVGVTQLKGVTFIKMGITDYFPKYTQKHIKRKAKKKPKEKPQFVAGQKEGAKKQPIDQESKALSQQT